MDGGTGVSSDGWHGRGKGEESIDGNSRVSSGSWQRREERGSADVSTREHVPSKCNRLPFVFERLQCIDYVHVHILNLV